MTKLTLEVSGTSQRDATMNTLWMLSNMMIAIKDKYAEHSDTRKQANELVVDTAWSIRTKIPDVAWESFATHLNDVLDEAHQIDVYGRAPSKGWTVGDEQQVIDRTKRHQLGDTDKGQVAFVPNSLLD